MIDRTIEQFAEDGEEGTTARFVGDVRVALDDAFSAGDVNTIVSRLTEMSETEGKVAKWAESTLTDLHERSPTSLVVSLELMRRGKSMTLAQALEMEYRMATAYCVCTLYFLLLATL
jgi:3-hydroxyisobutyryl-CoA hydrolase